MNVPGSFHATLPIRSSRTTWELASPASPLERGLARIADLTVFVVTAPATIGLAALLLRPFWALGALAIAFGYCWWSYASGQSLGMRLLGIQLRDETGGTPHVLRAAFRAAAIVAPLTAMLAFASATVPDPNGQTAPLNPIAAWGAAILVAAGLIDYLWMLGNGRRQALHDVIARTVVVRS